MLLFGILTYTIAFGRAENGWGDKVTVPHRVEKVYVNMVGRAAKYFKDLPVIA